MNTGAYDFAIVRPCIVTDSLWIKPTDTLISNFTGITTLHVSGSLSAHHQEFLAFISFGTFYAVVMNCWLPGVGWNCSSILLLVANGSSQLHKMYQSRCTAKNSWWWAERLPETCRVVIPVKLEISASVVFIHKGRISFAIPSTCRKLWLLCVNPVPPAVYLPHTYREWGILESGSVVMILLYSICTVVVCFLREDPPETVAFFTSIPNVFVCRSLPKQEPLIWACI